MALALVCAGGFACGYRFAGNGRLPAQIETVFISVFENRSLLLGVEKDFTDSLIREFTRRRAGSLADRRSADAVFSGVIRSISTDTVSHRDEYTSVERQVRVTVSARLVARDGRIVWRADDLSAIEDYRVEAEKHLTDQNLRRAVEKLADDLAQRLYNQLTAEF
jgi:outer membrane lipopolysaccharide assembly protein LptE/RlpB